MPRVALDSLNLAAAERELVREALARSESMDAAAERLGVSRRRLTRLITVHGLELPRWRRMKPGTTPAVG